MAAQTLNLTSDDDNETVKKIKIFDLLKDINLIVSFRYDDEVIAGWVNAIVRIFPTMDIEVVERLMLNFLKGEEIFDKESGIVNFTSRIKSYMGFMN